mmetsp:Transcript_3091/g.7299  ORF Transcript_3091/g.7299 Transcript_3091/m.7299 type:complete len:114 (-) Transcript_3091:179-520(-)
MELLLLLRMCAFGLEDVLGLGEITPLLLLFIVVVDEGIPVDSTNLSWTCIFDTCCYSCFLLLLSASFKNINYAMLDPTSFRASKTLDIPREEPIYWFQLHSRRLWYCRLLWVS